MLSAALLLVCQSMFWQLHLSGDGGSFPRPLKYEEEQHYLERCAQGDLDARNALVEHNLRLVAHIIKKMQSKRPIGGSGVYIFRKKYAANREPDALRQPKSRQLWPAFGYHISDVSAAGIGDKHDRTKKRRFAPPLFSYKNV